MLVLEVQAQPVVDADIEVADPDQGKQRDQIAAPVRKQQLEARDGEKDRGHVVAKAIFAGEQVEELPLQNRAAGLAFGSAVLLHLAKDGFMRDGPRNRGNRQREHEEYEDLLTKRHGIRCVCFCERSSSL